MRPAVRSLAARYGVAAGTVAAALAARPVAAAPPARLLLAPLVGDPLPFLSFALAVVAVAWHGGFGPSCLALLLAVPTVAYCFLPPRYDLGASLPAHQVQVFGFLFL